MSDVDVADRLSRRRARLFPLLAVIFLTQQAAYFSQSDSGRAVDQFKISAWLVLSIVLLAVLATGGGWLRSAEVRAMLNDDVARENRKRAADLGFWFAMGSAIGLYVVTLFEPVSGREAVHIIMTAGIASALLYFGMLEKRAHRDD